MSKTIVFTFLVALFAVVYAGSLVRNRRQASGGVSYLLPDGAELVLSKPIDTSFVCSEQGIYADLNNNCEIFHICHITEHPDGSGADMRQYSFFCGNQTVFDQFSMTCNTPADALPCSFAPEFFDLNKRVQEGRPDVHLHTDADVERYNTIKASKPAATA